MFDILIVWPMPALWLMAAGLVLVRRRAGRALTVAAGISLLAGAMPATGELLLAGLASGAPAYAGAKEAGYDAIVVPLAGSFQDPAGRWWPLAGSIVRTVRGRQLREETGLPLMVVGGAPFPSQDEPEAATVRRTVSLPPDAIVESTARDTFETAQAVATALAARRGEAACPRVIVVTDRAHVMRMSASLRRFGVAPVAAPPREFVDPRIVRTRWLDIVPSGRGLGLVRIAIREYVATGWYLVSGRIRLRDL